LNTNTISVSTLKLKPYDLGARYVKKIEESEIRGLSSYLGEMGRKYELLRQWRWPRHWQWPGKRRM